NIKKTITIVSELHQLILKELNISPDEECVSYYRYMNHLRFFAQRINENICPKTEDNDILKALLSKYEKEYNCSKKVSQYIYENYNYSTSDDEILYLTVHLTHLTNNAKREA
ncbi:MAG: PRD domain-containing protein, partial [Anaerotignaceae bacterium]